MDKASRSQELELAERAVQSGEIYNLSGLADGTAEVASPFSSADAQEVQKLLSACASISDLEYPSPRHVLRHGYRRQFEIGELNRLVGSDPERGNLGAGGEPRFVRVAHGKEDSVGSGRAGDPDDAVRSLSPIVAAIAGAIAATGLLLLALAIAGGDGPALSMAASIAVFTTVISVVIWRTGQAAVSPRASGDRDDDWSNLWVLRDGANLREAIAVSVRTGGLGLLMRPRDPVEDGQTETGEAEEVPVRPSRDT